MSFLNNYSNVFHPHMKTIRSRTAFFDIKLNKFLLGLDSSKTMRVPLL